MLLSYRQLAWFWGGVAWVSVVGGSTLQLLGPPSHAPQEAPAPVSAAPSPVPPAPAPSSATDAGQATLAPPLVTPVPTISAPAAVEAIAVPMTPPALSQPSRERPHVLVRRALAPPKGPRARGDGEDATLGERSQFLPGAEPTVPARREQATGFDRAAGYIGVFATGADGTRTFKAMP